MKAITKGSVELLYIQNLLKQQGVDLELVVETDASAAKGATSRLGCGKRMKHLDVQELWVQQVVKSGRIKIIKISTVDNVADFLTKPLDNRAIVKTMKVLNYQFLDRNGESEDDEDDENDDLKEQYQANEMDNGDLMTLLHQLAGPTRE